MKSPLYLLDSYAFIYRSYFAFLSRPLRNASGANVSAAFGFFRFLFNLFDERNPGAFAAVFDPKGKNFRHELYPEYKANRQKTPEDLHAQVPLVEEILKALGLPILRAEGYEADDVIATLAERCRAINPAIEVVLRTHSEEEARMLAREEIARVFFGEEELAKGMTNHVLERFAPGGEQPARA